MTSGNSRRRRRWPLAVLAILFGSALALVLAEVALRVFDPIGLNYQREVQRWFGEAVHLEWDGKPPGELDLDGRLLRMKPQLDVDLGSFRLKTNRLGCRGPDVAVPKPPDTFRILLLGDSVAFGWGVDDELTFARRLETEWNAAAPRVRLEVVNTGHPLYDTVQEAATARELVPQLQPDLVLLVFVVNDVEPSRDVAEALLSGKQPDPAEAIVLPHDFWSFTAETLMPVLPALAQFLGAQTNLDLRMRKRPDGHGYRPETFGKGPRGWPRSQNALRQIRDLCKAANVPFVVLDHTLPAILSLPPFCDSEGIPLAPLRFSAADHDLGICNSVLDSHANGKGNDLLLQRLRAALLERGLLPR